LEVKENGVTVDLAVPYLLTTEIKAQESLLQVEARREKNARQSNFNAVKNLPRIQTGGNVFQNDGNVIIIGTVKMERTKSIVLHLNAMPVNGHAVRTNLITLIVSQAIIGVIKKSIVMTSQMNKIATIVRAKRMITSAVVAFV